MADKPAKDEAKGSDDVEKDKQGVKKEEAEPEGDDEQEGDDEEEYDDEEGEHDDDDDDEYYDSDDSVEPTPEAAFLGERLQLNSANNQTLMSLLEVPGFCSVKEVRDKYGVSLYDEELQALEAAERGESLGDDDDSPDSSSGESMILDDEDEDEEKKPPTMAEVEELLAARRAELPGDHPAAMEAANYLAKLYLEDGRPDDAEAILEVVLEESRVGPLWEYTAHKEVAEAAVASSSISEGDPITEQVNVLLVRNS